MARMGVFSRNDDTPESIPRSLQYLTHRNTITTQYMIIQPNFTQVLQPGESIRIKPTNFVKTIPMVTPQLSRVRLVQRFYAVPLRIMWRPWEKWIKGEEDSQFLYDLPYLVNNYGYSASGISGTLDGTNARVANNRGIVLDQYGHVPDVLSKNDWTLICGPGELGDAFRYPLYSSMGYAKKSDGTELGWLAPHAFYACAYQMVYSYGYRSPNVQTRIDDYYDLFVNQRYFSSPTMYHVDKPQLDEFPNLVAWYNSSTSSGSPVPEDHRRFTIWRERREGVPHAYDLATFADRDSIVRTSWENVEHFPLKAGANLSMLAEDVDSETGMSVYKPSNISLYRYRFANWQTDYFTSCNPWQQRGDEAQIPVTGQFQVDLGDVSATFSGVTEQYDLGKYSVNNNGSLSTADLFAIRTSDGQYDFLGSGNIDGDSSYLPAFIPAVITPKGNVSVTSSPSLVQSSGLYVSPSAFRFAMALQHVKELQAQTDNRYKSYMHKIFGSYIPDNRIDRPEFLGGSVQEINVAEVTQTSATQDGSSPLGTLAGKGTSAKTGGSVRFHASEHTVIIGLIHIIPDTLYTNGLDREDNVHDRFDFPLPQFSRLSEQAVYNWELSCVGLRTVDGDTSLENQFKVFGYEPVYNNLRWKKSMALGDFRDFLNSKGNYEYYKPWLIQRDFGYSITHSSSEGYTVKATTPTLSDKFLSGRYGCDYSNFVVSDPLLMKPFMLDSYFEVRMTRIIPTRGLPAKFG